MRCVLDVTTSDGAYARADRVEIFIDPGSRPNLAPFLIEPLVFFTPEGQTHAATVIAIDPEGGSLNYAILPGQDFDFFTLYPVTGELHFHNAPVFEVPLDRNTDNTYLVSVCVSDDHGNTAMQTVEINVTGIQVLPPAMPQIARPDPLDLFQPVRSFLSASTTDPLMDLDLELPLHDASERLRLAGEDADRFDIDPQSGLIALRADTGLATSGSFDGDAITASATPTCSRSTSCCPRVPDLSHQIAHPADCSAASPAL
ncbi:MAG: cadherin repeat domain-containing protein [Pseudomonadota bacterium]